MPINALGIALEFLEDIPAHQDNCSAHLSWEGYGEYDFRQRSNSS